MCGIAGIFDKRGNSSDLISLMIETLNHRGPDGNGIWQNNQKTISMGHTRLSILELSEAGSQPMVSHSGRYVITYNGEIYNHNELRSRELKSFKFTGGSDTETLLACFEKYGVINSLQYLTGMFSFGVWDQEKEILTIARDRTGEKPIYYSNTSNSFIFSSELNAFENNNLNNEISTEALNLFLAFSYVPSPYSIYKGIYKLKAGHYIQYSYNREAKQIPYWSVEETLEVGKNNILDFPEDEICNTLNDNLVKVIKNQSIADVPVGAFLSGGIDSSTIVAIMQSISNKKVKTFTIGSNEKSFDESSYAKKVANYLGTDHTELILSSKDVLNTIPLLPKIYDEPFADSSQIPTFLVSKLAKKHVKVVLTGDGADELFGGYERYLLTSKLWNKSRYLPSIFRRSFENFVNKIPQNLVDSSYSSIEKFLPSKLQFAYPYIKLFKLANLISSSSALEMYFKLITYWDGIPPVNNFNNQSFLSNYLDSTTFKDDNSIIQCMMINDLKTYLTDDILQKVDRASMSVSLETRCPFLDHNLIKLVLSLPMEMKLKKDKSKWILRKILNRYLPKDLYERPKMGFNVPLDNWLKGPLKEWAEELLSEKSLGKHNLLDTKVIRKAWYDHINNKRNMQFPLWNVLMFQAWIETKNK